MENTQNSTHFLTGRHALVTGGGTGIGLAIAEALAAAGAEVTITGRRGATLEQAAEGHANLHPQVMDVGIEDSVLQGVANAEAARGPVSIAIANAGIAEGASLARTDLEFWRRMMTTNLDGAFLTFRACLPGMKAAGWGRGIAVSSIAGLKGLRGAPAYSASKHGMIGLVRALAADFTGTPMTFNALCPGYTETNIIDENVTRIKDRAGISAEEARAVMVGANPHGRLIAPQEVATAALWLCQDGSQSVNGQCIEISGGEV